jgi:hypothetical protein
MNEKLERRKISSEDDEFGLEDSEFRENGEHVGHAVNRQSL